MSAPADDVFRCELCGVVLEDARALEEHKEMHAEQLAEGEPVVSAHRCSFCSASFATPEELRAHNASAHGK